MPGRGAPSAGILARRQQAAASGSVSHGARPRFEQFCVGQLERIQRITSGSIRRVQEARRAGAAAQRKAHGEELQVEVRGLIGSDAHPDDDTPSFEGGVVQRAFQR